MLSAVSGLQRKIKILTKPKKRDRSCIAKTGRPGPLRCQSGIQIWQDNINKPASGLFETKNNGRPAAFQEKALPLQGARSARYALIVQWIEHRSPKAVI